MSDAPSITALCSEQRQCWQQGSEMRVEDYLDQFPTLRTDPEGLLDLIYNEIVLREQSGQSPALDEYLQRFPQFATELQLQFDVHRALQGDQLTRAVDLPDMGVTGEAAPQRVQPSTVPTIPGYEIRGELGRGGMGVVYAATQVELKRPVALKMILAGSHAGPKELARFRREAEAVARLRHPNIVQIYEVNLHDGVPFFSLEFVDGGSLKNRLAGQPWPAQQAAELVETLARALDAVHQQGIVHRDLKPANILLASGGHEPPVDLHTGGSCPPLAVPKIADFGLAKLLDAPEIHTTTGAFVGTPTYTSPEQAAGDVRAIGPAADIHALGIILYELLTGRPPFQAATPLATLEEVRSQEPVSPLERNPDVPRDLATICLKCLEKEPARRYETALRLAEDLHRFLAGEPIQGRAQPMWRSWLRRVRRRPTLAVVITAMVITLAVFVALQVRTAVAVRRSAEQARSREQQEENQRRSAARQTWQQFMRHRDDAVFAGSYATLFPDADAPTNSGTARRLALAALEQVHFGASDSVPTLNEHWSPAEKAEIVAGCSQLLLILADIAARPTPDDTVEKRQEKARAALRLLDRAAGLAPPTLACHLRRARYLAQLGDAGAAGRERELAANAKAIDAADHFQLGVEHYHAGNAVQARAEFEKAVALQPGDFWSRYFLAVCLLKLQQPAEAQNCLTDCLKQRPAFIWGHLLRAFAAEQQGAYAAAESDYARALALGPNADARYFLHVNRARMWLRQDRPVQAIADLKEAVVLKPDHFEGHLNLARAWRQADRKEEAQRAFDDAARLGAPAAARAAYHLEWGQQLHRDGKFADCISACEAALALTPENAPAHELHGLALLALRRYAEAARAFDRYFAVGGAPSLATYRGRGLARMQQKEYLGAVDDYSHALELAPKPDAGLHANRGWAYFFADACKPALRDFETAMRLDPRHPNVHTGRGLARVMLGQYKDGVADAEEALRRKPDNPEMMHNLACLFAQARARVERDAAEPDRRALAVSYGRRSIDAIRATLAMLPAEGRAAFWRDKVVGEAWLQPVRGLAEFQPLQKEFGGAP